MKDNGFTKKVAIVGTGFVGMSFAYALLCDGACDEMVLIDINREKALGEAMDLNHGLAFAKTNMKITAGDYGDCADADIVVICAGVSQKPGEDRISLLQRNRAVFESIVAPVLESGFDGIFLVATNPVDIMTRVVHRLSGFPSRKVIGSGTTLDTARLRYLLGEYFTVDPKNVHAYVIGEHGDSEMTPWSQALVGTKPIREILAGQPEKYTAAALDEIAENVTKAAYKIIQAKSATYYGIGLALVRIVKAIFGGENSILTVSVRLDGEYGVQGVFAGVPCILGREGVREVLTLELENEELAKFRASCNLLNGIWKDSFAEK
ncbi:MAG TPA: L-lactate dehydrogenase [Candidatus Fimenecus stercoravium]|nr:L-lactate dehydrogenase [Candidatus Fimenecus stercoravium]